jgi:hypothetical protein
MERGLLWLPLLIVFFWLAYIGWNEYQKIEVYRLWAENFDRGKYDIYAVLGQKGDIITWGKPTRVGIVNVNSFSLQDTKTIRLLVNDREVNLDQLPSKGNACLEFILDDGDAIKIPFTEIDLASQWLNFLKNKIQLG